MRVFAMIGTLALILTGCAGSVGSHSAMLELDERVLPAEQNPWWHALGSAQINVLASEAQRSSPEVLTAYARYLENKAGMRGARGSLFPTVSTASTVDLRGPAEDFAREDSLGIGLNIDWQADLFKGLRNNLTSQKMNVEAQRYLLADARRVTAAETVAAAVTIAALNSELMLIEKSITRREQSVAAVQKLKSYGYATEIDQMRSFTQLNQSKAQRAQLIAARNEQKNRIGVLLGGRVTGVLDSRLDDLNLQLALSAVSEDALLETRPDIRAAWFRLQANQFDSKSRRAELLPSLNLSLRLNTTDASDFSLSPADILTESIAQIAMPLLNRGRLLANIDRADARVQQSLIAYENTALSALLELDNYAVRFENLRDSLGANANAVTAAQSVLDGTQRLFEGGRGSYLDVVLAEDALIRTELEQVRAKRDFLLSYVRYHSGLG